jgi:hypothetical protein
MTTRYLTTDQNGNGDQTYWDINGYFLHGPSGEKLNLGSGNTTVTASNEIVQIGTSYIRIPQGISNERPNPSYAGMIRYLTNDNLIEYYNSNTGVWIPISQQPPEIISIDPQYYPVGSTDPLTINGSNFSAGATVTFIGNDGTIYGPNGSSFITSNQITCIPPVGVKDNSLNDPFDIILTNPSGLSSQLDNALFFNEKPIFVTSQTPSVYATVDASTILTGQLDISATDPENHYPITFAEISGNNLSPLILETSGVISGTVPFPTPVTATSQSVVFTVEASDNIFASSIGSFTYVINRPQNDLNVSSFGSVGGDYTKTYLDTIEGSGNTIGGPVIGGSIVYQFKTTGLTGSIAPVSIPFDINYCVIAGGGAGGCAQGGGGGAGGVKLGKLNLSSSISVSVGAGGIGNTTINTVGGSGSDSVLGSITASGGGGGGGSNRSGSSNAANGASGGSGGGGGGQGNGNTSAGISSTGEGSNGGIGGSGSGSNFPELGGGGGGAGQPGSNGVGPSASAGSPPTTAACGDGGDGIQLDITGTEQFYAGGGGGGGRDDFAFSTFGFGGRGGGGSGRIGGASDPYGGIGLDGSANYGGGGGGGGGNYGTTEIYSGGNGGSGTVILRFPAYSFFSPTNYLTISSVNNGSYKINYLNSSFNRVGYPDPNGYTIFIFQSSTNTNDASFSIIPNNTFDISYVVVGGGGSGGTGQGGGGGAGGFVEGYHTSFSGNHTLIIGKGGLADISKYNQPGAQGTSGSNSSISGSLNVTAGGGGAGGGTNSGGTGTNGLNGISNNGSGGGGGANKIGSVGSGGSGNGTGGTGGDGSTSGSGYGGGGGGASANGANSSGAAGAGGNGIYSSILGYYVGGGGGGGSGGANIDGAVGGLGGGGQGRGTGITGASPPLGFVIPNIGESGINGTGGGGGGGSFGVNNLCFMGGNGGSGVIGILFRTS